MSREIKIKKLAIERFSKKTNDSPLNFTFGGAIIVKKEIFAYDFYKNYFCA